MLVKLAVVVFLAVVLAPLQRKARLIYLPGKK